MKALVIGATGATGKDLVGLLLDHTAYTCVVIFVRRATGIAHPKLEEVITDFDKLDAVADHIKGDVAFLLLGTTLKAAGSKEKQWKIDHDIPVAFAELAKRNGVSKMVLLSAYGAAVSSRIFYSKMKGALEDKIAGLSFFQYIIFRPGLLLRKGTDRWGERVSGAVLKFLNKIGVLRKFRPLATLILAEKLAKAPFIFPYQKHIIELNKIFEL